MKNSVVSGTFLYKRSYGKRRVKRGATELILLLSILCLYSCEQKQDEYSIPKFKKELSKEFDLLGKELEFGSVNSIGLYKDYLVLVALDSRTSRFLHIVDKRTGEFIFSTAALGRGPGEIANTPYMSLVGHECYLYDRMSQVTQVYDLDLVLKGEVGFSRTIEERSLTFPPIGIYYGPEGKVVFSNESYIQRDPTMTEPRIVLEEGSAQYTYNEYPIPDRVRTWYMYMTPHLAFSPDFSKMAVVPAYGAILERFNLSEGISLIGTDRFVEPDFTIKDNRPDFSEHAIPYGFTNLTCTNNKIIVGMVGEVVSGLGTRKLDFPHFPIIAVLDWNGRPLMKVRNSLNIECLAYDEDEDVVYAVVRDSKDISYLGKMAL